MIVDVEPVPKAEISGNTDEITSQIANPALVDGPIAFNLLPQGTDLPDTIALTLHGDEKMVAELALIKPGEKALGLVLGLKMRMSPRDHIGPQVLRLPVVVLPEGSGIFDKKNARWLTATIDLKDVYEDSI